MTHSPNHGYSGTPLAQKLGFKPGSRVGLSSVPAGYSVWLEGADNVTFEILGEGRGLDAAHVFLRAPSDLPDAATAAIAQLRAGGMLWLSWPKKSSKMFRGVTEDMLRAHVLPLGWVDVKVCAINDDWSGLKFVKRRG